MTDPTPPGSRRKRRTSLLAGAAVAALAVAGVVYATGRPGKDGSVTCHGAAATVARLDPFVTGEVAALNLSRPAQPVPELAFEGPDGTHKTLADFKGRTVLLNLWATWCVPCRKEMPALDRLQQKRGGKDFSVVAVNLDQTRLDRPKAFLRDAGILNLPLYADPSAAALRTLKAFGLPTTLLIDPDGCEIGVMAGPAEWDSGDADKLIEAAVAAQPQG